MEFKSEIPRRDEVLKKLTSFANTFGGYLIIGATADANGKIVAIDGIAPVRGLKQTLVQQCFQFARPPLQIEVSNPIRLAAGKVCYVVQVQESDLAPHFLADRKGAYIRTDELSGRFAPELATQEELLHLFGRRAVILARRESLLTRARSRWDTYISTTYGAWQGEKKTIGARFDLSIVPRYPSRSVSTHSALRTLLLAERPDWRQVGFPRVRERLTQHESVLILRPDSKFFSLLEANVWGLLFYASEIEMEEHNYKGIHWDNFLGLVLVYLEHARCITKALGTSGNLLLSVRFQGVRGVPWAWFNDNTPVKGPESVLDDTIEFPLETSVEALQTNRDDIAKDIVRLACFALNWADVASDEATLRDAVIRGYRFNMWPYPEPLLEAETGVTGSFGERC